MVSTDSIAMCERISMQSPLNKAPLCRRVDRLYVTIDPKWDEIEVAAVRE